MRRSMFCPNVIVRGTGRQGARTCRVPRPTCRMCSAKGNCSAEGQADLHRRRLLALAPLPADCAACSLVRRQHGVGAHQGPDVTQNLICQDLDLLRIPCCPCTTDPASRRCCHGAHTARRAPPLGRGGHVNAGLLAYDATARSRASCAWPRRRWGAAHAHGNSRSSSSRRCLAAKGATMNSATFR